jgi:hypothetical protein
VQSNNAFVLVVAVMPKENLELSSCTICNGSSGKEFAVKSGFLCGTSIAEIHQAWFKLLEEYVVEVGVVLTSINIVGLNFAGDKTAIDQYPLTACLV